MPRGFTQIAKVAEKIKEKSEFEDYGPPVLFLKLPDDQDTAQVRFLEQGEEVYGYWYHDFSNIDGSGWKTKVPCLDQDDQNVPCPGCREDLPRKFEGFINLIWRNAPKYKRDAEGRRVKENDSYIVEGHEDQVAVWRCGIKLFNKVLKRKDHAYKGLGTRDFEITREGTGLQTTYAVEPVDPDGGPSPLSDADKKLAANKYDLEQLARFVDEAKFDEIIASKLNGGSADDTDDIKDFLSSSPYGEEN